LRRRPSRSAAERPKEDQPKGSGQKRTAAVEAHSVEERPFRAVKRCNQNPFLAPQAVAQRSGAT
jgi:hypothetical protein